MAEPLYHPTLWTCVVDYRDKTERLCLRYDTELKATAMAAQMRKLANVKSTSVLKPSGKS